LTAYDSFLVSATKSKICKSFILHCFHFFYFAFFSHNEQAGGGVGSAKSTDLIKEKVSILSHCLINRAIRRG
jgi:hypothetical protein